jgi:RHS repeat-associated protein
VVYFAYDAAGQRVRKVWEHSGLVEERIYLDGYEVYRKRDSSGLALERQTLHVMDGVKRIALVETTTVDVSAGGAFEAATVTRFQLGNHLGSAVLEVDETGKVISYEEYHPYGTTAYHAKTAAEVSLKRYRYTGKERDEETGLHYYGARYHATWLGRWTSCDPAGLDDGINMYAYVHDRPTVMTDLQGRQGRFGYDACAVGYACASDTAPMYDPDLDPEDVKVDAEGLHVWDGSNWVLYRAPPAEESDESEAPDKSKPEAPSSPPKAGPDCQVKDLKAEFRDWEVEWPNKEGKYTVRLPVKLTVELEPGVSKADCLICQEKKGIMFYAGEPEGDRDQYKPDLPPGAREAKPLWTGTEWTGGDLPNEEAGWKGQTGTFYDAPGFWRIAPIVVRGPTTEAKPLFSPPVGIRTPDTVVKTTFPLLMLGGTTKDRFFRLHTYVADKRTGAKLRELYWGLRIEAETPAREKLKYEKADPVP